MIVQRVFFLQVIYESKIAQLKRAK